MKETFRTKRFRDESLARIALCNKIIEKYQEQGLRLTLRQLYYQLVTKNVITNEEKSYDNLGKLVSEGRLAGLIDWDAIEDRVRQPRVPQEFTGVEDLIDTAIRAYRLPRWAGQESYIELWVEKDALAGVLRPIAQAWHVTLMVNRGYSSTSAMYESAQRFLEEPVKQPVLLYLGDHDPSGEDMVRDISDRLEMFGVTGLEVVKLALTMEQVEAYAPPPNPAKMSDSRARGYVAKHGRQSWEVDALPPEVLQQLIVSAIRARCDMEKMTAIEQREEKHKARLRKAAARIGKED